MVVVSSRRSVMTLYSGAADPHSHRARIVLAEKNITYEVVQIGPGELPEDLIDLNPYNSVPTLTDRDLVLFDSRVIMEYLDERFPHPPLMPVDPVSRARTRLMLFRIDRDWYSLLWALESGSAEQKRKAAGELKDSLMSILPVFEAKPYFMSEEFSVVDCTIAPLLWRLGHYGVTLPKGSAAITNYMTRVFNRPGFKESLTTAEKELPAAL